MLSVVIATHNHERPLVRTLASLVPASMAGLVADVVIADAGSTDDTARVADAGGCEFLQLSAPRGERLMQAAQHARAKWLLFLAPGVALEPGWVQEANVFLQDAWATPRGETRTATFRVARSAFAKPRLADLVHVARQNILGQMLMRPHPQQGLIISKAHYLELGGHATEASHPEIDLLARLGRGASVLLNAKVFAPEI